MPVYVAVKPFTASEPWIDPTIFASMNAVPIYERKRRLCEENGGHKFAFRCIRAPTIHEFNDSFAVKRLSLRIVVFLIPVEGGLVVNPPFFAIDIWSTSGLRSVQINTRIQDKHRNGERALSLVPRVVV